MSPAQSKRLRRIQLRASQPIQDALAAGVISIRRADILLHLPENEQKSQLDRILRSKQTEILRCKAAVKILREHLDRGNRDLVGLQRDLHQALSQAN